MYTPFYKTWWVRVIVIGALAIAAYYALRLPGYYRWYKAMEPYREQNKEATDYYNQMLEEQARMEALYAADTYGGQTPQETWYMFIDALKKRDTDLAAKYFVVEKREEIKKDFELGLSSGGVETLLRDVIPLIVGGDMYPDGNRFEFYTIDIDGGPGFVFMLVKNPITGVWKIEDL